MLALAVAQVESSMTDGAQSVDTLTQSFTHMAHYIKKIRTVTQKVTPDTLQTFQEVIEWIMFAIALISWEASSMTQQPFIIPVAGTRYRRT